MVKHISKDTGANPPTNMQIIHLPNSFDRMNNQNNRYCRYLRLLLRKFYVFLINYYKIY